MLENNKEPAPSQKRTFFDALTSLVARIKDLSVAQLIVTVLGTLFAAGLGIWTVARDITGEVRAKRAELSDAVFAYTQERETTCREDVMGSLADQAFTLASAINEPADMGEALVLKLDHAMEYGTFDQAEIFNSKLKAIPIEAFDRARRFDIIWHRLRFANTKVDREERALLEPVLDDLKTSTTEERYQTYLRHRQLQDTWTSPTKLEFLPASIDPDLYQMVAWGTFYGLDDAQAEAMRNRLNPKTGASGANCPNYLAGLELIKIYDAYQNGKRATFLKLAEDWTPPDIQSDYISQYAGLIRFRQQENDPERAITLDALLTHSDGWPEMDHVVYARAMPFASRHDLPCDRIADRMVELKALYGFYTDSYDRDRMSSCYVQAGRRADSLALIRDLDLTKNAPYGVRERIRQRRCIELSAQEPSAYAVDADCEALSGVTPWLHVKRLLALGKPGEVEEVSGNYLKRDNLSDYSRISLLVDRARTRQGLGQGASAVEDFEAAYRLALTSGKPGWIRSIAREMRNLTSNQIPWKERRRWNELDISSQRRAGSRYGLYTALYEAGSDAFVTLNPANYIPYFHEAYDIAHAEGWGWQALMTNTVLSQFRGESLTEEASARRLQETRVYRVDRETRFLWDLAELYDQTHRVEEEEQRRANLLQLSERYSMLEPDSYASLPEGARLEVFRAILRALPWEQVEEWYTSQCSGEVTLEFSTDCAELKYLIDGNLEGSLLDMRRLLTENLPSDLSAMADSYFDCLAKNPEAMGRCMREIESKFISSGQSSMADELFKNFRETCANSVKTETYNQESEYSDFCPSYLGLQ